MRCQVDAIVPGIAGKNRDVQTADIDAQLQRIRRNHAANPCLPQAALDLPPLVGQIAATIARRPRRPRHRPLLDESFKITNQNLRDQAGCWRKRSRECSASETPRRYAALP